MADQVKQDEELELYVRQFQDACTGSQVARAASELCRDYFDGEQLSSEVKAALKKRHQPEVVDNRIKDKVEAWLGSELSTRTDPKAFPRTPQEEGAADAATDALRFICDDNHFPRTKSAAFECMLIEGTGGAEVIIEKVNDKPVIRQRRIRWDRMYWDEHSMLADFSDAQFLGIVVWMDLADAKKKYPLQADDYDAMISGSFEFGTTFDDKPMMWVDRTRKRVQILEHYHRRDDTWHRCVFTRAGIVEPSAPVVYLDEAKKPECPLIFQSAYVSRDGKRYGVVPRYMPLQDEINHRRSKLLHLLNSRQTIGEKGAVEDVNEMKKEMAKPDGHVQVTPNMRFDVNPTTDLSIGQFQILADTLQSLSASGPNSAMQGQESKQSGRAQQVAQQAGVLQLGPVLDNLRHWQHRMMVASWNRVRQFWTEETWIRVTDNEKTRFVALNRKVTKADIVREKAQKQGATPEQMQQLEAGIAADPESNDVVVMNGAAEMDVDIIIDEAPDTVTLQSEQWLQLTELAKNGVPIKPQTLIKASNLKNKDELIDDIDEQEKKGAGIPPQVAEQIKKVGEEQEKQAQALKQQEQQLQDQQMQMQQRFQAEQAKLQEQQLALTKQASEFSAQVTIAKADMEATRKIFAAEQRIASANRRADQAEASAKRPNGGGTAHG